MKREVNGCMPTLEFLCFAMCSHSFDRSSTILSSLSIKVVSRIDVLAVKMVKMPNHCIYNLVKKKKKVLASTVGEVSKD